jgi:ATP-binding cassette subfamily C (CFTR/MRP) protein 1
MPQGQQIPFLPSTPATTYAYGYLTASKHGRQPLCGNSEGWGPISSIRYDFTPCFLDVWIAVVAGFGIVGGAGALWYLYRNCSPQPVKRNWHFYAKLVRIFLSRYTGVEGMNRY